MSLSVGQVLAPREFGPITQEQLKAYAEAAGDPNPIHLDEQVAKRMGLPGVIAHGMLTAAFIGETAVEAAGQGYCLRRVQTRFKAMTLLGDVVIVSATVKAASDLGITLDLVAKNQRGETTTTGVVELLKA